jgi:hypothetical protein
MKDNLIKTKLQKIKKWLSDHDHKKTIEITTSSLTIIMMITAITYNITNVKNQNKKDAAASLLTSTPIQVVVENPISTNSGDINPPPKIGTTNPISTPTTAACKKDIGEVEILSPLDGEIITSDNVCIKISTSKDYCAINWAYKLDNSNWSDFTGDDSLCLYNLSSGKKNLQIKIKSTVADKTATLQRTFTYQPSITPTPSSNTTPTVTQ